MKCIIIGHEFAEANTGNLYCKLEVRPANDEWAASFNYVMFITEAMKESLEAKFPKEILPVVDILEEYLLSFLSAIKTKSVTGPLFFTVAPSAIK